MRDHESVTINDAMAGNDQAVWILSKHLATREETKVNALDRTDTWTQTCVPMSIALLVLAGHNGSTERQKFDRKVPHVAHGLADEHSSIELNDVIERNGKQPIHDRVLIEGCIKPVE
jgi:hypothetical protein